MHPTLTPGYTAFMTASVRCSNIRDMHIVKTLYQANIDIWLLWGSVFLRMVSFGITNQVMVLFLQLLEIPHSKIGSFMTLTLIGDVLISYFLSWNADKIGRRVVLVTGTIMMLGAGVVFATQSNYWFLLLAAIFGVISPSGDETGPFKTIEEASLAHMTPHNHRPGIFAFHGMFGTVGNALGALASGFIIDYLSLTLHWDLISCYRAVFVIYAFIAVVKLFIMVALSERCEVWSKVDYETDDETDPLLSDTEPQGAEEAPTDVSNSTVAVTSKLLLVFFFDSLGYGFMPESWTVYYFKTVFKISASLLGSLFFVTNFINMFSTIPSAILAKALGPVKAILCTQAPSAIIFILIPFCKDFVPASALLLAYKATTTMDVVPRQILITSVVKPEVMTRVMGTVNTVKTFARCVGPIFTGRLSEAGKLFWCYFISGGFTLLLDLMLAMNFFGLDDVILSKQRVEHDIQ